MIRAIVVDDEAIARAHVGRLLERTGNATVIAEAACGRTALLAIEEQAPDVVFLDVEMPEVDGLFVASRARDTLIVFTTAHSRFAVDAFSVNAVDFLLKPLTSALVTRSLARVQERMGATAPSSTPRLMIADRGRTEFIDVARIDRFFALDKYTAFTIEGREVLIRESLDALEARYGRLGFLRLHRGELVRADAIVSLQAQGDGAVATLASGAVAVVGRRRVAAVREALRNQHGNSIA